LSDPEDEAFRLYGYRKPSWCTCVFVRNMELKPCIKCGALTPFIYASVSGFQTRGPLCPACHDEIDDCSPEHGETDERTPWPKQAGGASVGGLERQIDRELRLRYLREIGPDPEIYCLLTFGLHEPGDPECEHDWKMIENEPEYAVWKCSKCDARAGCDVWD